MQDPTPRRTIHGNVMQLRQFMAVVVLVAILCGCRDSDEVRREADVAHPTVNADLHVTTAGQAAIGLATAKAEATSTPQAIPATGWLAARPPAEIVVKAPSTRFV